jgi:predicted permease
MAKASAFRAAVFVKRRSQVEPPQEPTVTMEPGTGPWRYGLTRDLRYAFRQLFRGPGFALTVVLTLSLGVGANLAIFQLLQAALFAPLPVAQAKQLYSLRAVKSPFDGQWFFSFPAYEQLRQATAKFAPVIARSGISQGVVQANGRSPEKARLQLVSDNFFVVLGIPPAAGRLFLESDVHSAQNQWPVVLRYGYWKQSFGADPSIVGRGVVINGTPAVIVGVAREGFAGVVAGDAPDLWLPLAAQASGHFHSWFDSLGPGSGANLDASYLPQRTVFWLWLLARLPDAGKSAVLENWTGALQPDLALLASAAKDAHDRDQILHTRVQLVSAAMGEGTLREDYSRSLLVLSAMAGLVLLMGCVNLANLQLSRVLKGRRELAVRTALGASRWSLLRQLLVENLLLTLIGGLLALFISRLLSSLLLHWAGGSGRPLLLDLPMGPEVLALAAGLLLAALGAFTLLPAWHMTRIDLGVMMKSKANFSALQGRTARRWSNLLVMAQVSFSMLLLGTAGMFAQTLLNLSRVDAGLDRDHVISVHLDFTSAGFKEDSLPALYERMRMRLKALPAVRDAGVSMCAIPGCVWNTALHVYGHPELSEKKLRAEENHVGPGYFSTLGIPLLEGRDFDERDRPNSQPVAVLNRALARQLFGGESPIGHRIGYESAPRDATYLIVGEAADARVDDLRSAPPPAAYFSIDQRPAPAGAIEVGASGRIDLLYSVIRQSLLALEPNLPITDIVPLSAEYESGLSREKLLARLTGIFGGLALALAALGFYGLLSFEVTRRTSEIGVRMAMGATRSDVYVLVLRRTLGILIAGLIPGMLSTELLGFLLRNLLYGTGVVNLSPLLFAACILFAAGALATLRPARRAAFIDPVTALQTE